MSKTATKIYAIVKERDEQLFVCTLSAQEMDDNGDMGIEMLVKAWCERKRLTFIDYAC
jgi:hypothetical protein